MLPVYDYSFTSNHNQKEEHTHAHTKRRAEHLVATRGEERRTHASAS